MTEGLEPGLGAKSSLNCDQLIPELLTYDEHQRSAIRLLSDVLHYFLAASSLARMAAFLLFSE